MKILFIIPGDINLPTGGYRYDRAILNEWQSSGVEYELVNLEGNYPFPSELDRQGALEQIKHFPDADIAVIDGLAGGVLPDFTRKLSQAMPVIALIHHPLFLENGLTKQQAESLKSLEENGLRYVSGIITTSPTTSKIVSEVFKLAQEINIHTVEPGLVRSEISNGSQSSIKNLLCVGSIIERKGHRDLLSALANLKHLSWHLRCIGMIGENNQLYNEMADFINSNDLSNRVYFDGDMSEDELELAYSKADIFVLPSLYEGYGMAYAEAIVRGVPVIGTRAGAIPDTVPADCGILVKPGNVTELQNAIETILTDEDNRLRYKKACLDQASNFPTWKQSADKFTSILREAI